MEQSRLKRHAALAILMVGVATALVAIGRLLAQGGDRDDAQTDEQDAWHRFSTRCASDSLKTPPPPEALALEEADFRGCGGGNRVSDFWTADIQGLYTIPVPLAEIPLEKPGEERR